MKSITENLRLGVMELFAVLMPGAALCLVLGQCKELKNFFLDLLPNASSEWQGGLTFFIAAYFLGYVTYSIGGKMDNWVDKFWIVPAANNLVHRVTPLKVAEIGFDDPKDLNNYQWALARLEMEQPELYADVEYFQATAKFFRSMVVVAIVGAIIFFFSGKLYVGLSALGMVLLSLYLYADRRRKSLDIAYKRIVTMIGASSPIPTMNSNINKDLGALNLKISNAEKDKDFPFLNAVLSDKLMFRRANGVVVDKKAYLIDLPNTIYHEVNPIVELIQFNPQQTAAYVRLKVAATLERDSKTITGVWKNERVFHLEMDGNWRMVSWVNEKV